MLNCKFSTAEGQGIQANQAFVFLSSYITYENGEADIKIEEINRAPIQTSPGKPSASLNSLHKALTICISLSREACGLIQMHFPFPEPARTLSTSSSRRAICKNPGDGRRPRFGMRLCALIMWANT